MPSTPDTCHVWWAAPQDLRSGHLRLLSDFERQRVTRLRSGDDRTRSLTAAVLLRLVVGALVGVDPREIAVDRGCRNCGASHGGPRIAGHAVHVSISHAAERVAVAVSTSAAVGVDVEAIRPVDLGSLAPLVLGRRERAESTADFFAAWVRKEALTKATGDGLRVPLSGVRLSRDGELRRYAGRPHLAAKVVSLAAGDRYAAAVALLTRNAVAVHQRDAAPLLADSSPG